MFGHTHRRLLEREKRCEELRSQRDQARHERDELKLKLKELRSRQQRLERDLQSGCLSTGVGPTEMARMDGRRLLAARYLKGQGLEIGAMHLPLPLPEGAKALYADYKSREESILKHPELDPSKMVPVDILMSGDTLDQLPEESQDFLIANHMLEHCEDFVRVLKNFHRVLRWEGVLFLTLPDKRYTFDYRRPLTPHSHIVQDHREGPLPGRYAHYVEYFTMTGPAPVAELLPEAEVLELPHLDIHYHVWDQTGMIRLFNDLRTDFNLAYEIETFMQNGIEGIFVLRKTVVNEADRSQS